MRSDMIRFFLCAAAPLLAIGCRTVDVASRHSGPPPKCEIHGAEMRPELIRVSSGEVVYLWYYHQIAQARFPHHGGSVFSGEREFRHTFVRRVRDFVCPDCTEAYEEFWRKPEFRLPPDGRRTVHEASVETRSRQ